jgi:DNA repair photolyase
MDFIQAKNLIHPVKGGQGWFGVTHNVNIYRGCDHGCIYCDSRSSCYQIANFDTIRAKENADIKIDHELSNKRKKGIVGLGGMNDPYNSNEKELEYTRKALESFNKYQFGVHVITKSDLVIRDIDLFQAINRHSPVNIGITITTGSDVLQKDIERNVSSSSKRFRALKRLSDNNLFCGVLMMPILPFINDTIDNIDSIVTKAYQAGAHYIYPSFGVTLRDNQRQYFFKQIGSELTKQYIDTFGESYMCISPNHKDLKKHFTQLCEKYGILYKMEDIVKGMHASVKSTQLSLF